MVLSGTPTSVREVSDPNARSQGRNVQNFAGPAQDEERTNASKRSSRITPMR
jgi:hypothetical protein